MPMIAIMLIDQSDLAVLIKSYLTWCAPAATVVTLILYHKARRRMLAPFIKQLEEQAAEHCKEP